ncbi:MAG: 50S ribosomal protein L35 [Deltaproteobacteria bacterium]|nr:MAG: 50S ribosomal protein L35 [Deltaproteobacteria bacterium]
MPKMKTNRAASRRFKVSGSGKIVRRKANKSHILTKKSRTRKRRLRQSAIMRKEDVKIVRPLIPYL